MYRQFPCGIPLGPSPTALICPQTWETSWPALPIPSNYPKKILGNVADLIAQRFLGAWSKNCSRVWLQQRQTRTRVSGNMKPDQPVSTVLNKTGPGMTFCQEKLNTAGLPNALFAPFPCFFLFSNSIWIVSLLLGGRSYTVGRKGIIFSHSNSGFPRDIFPPLTQLSKTLNSEHIEHPRTVLRKTEEN